MMKPDHRAVSSEARDIKFPPKDAGQGISRFRVAAVLVFVILNLAVFLLRAVSVWRYGGLFIGTGGDALVIYPVWKAIHHFPVYEWPLKYPFSLALYNYLFYYSYAFFLKLLGITGAGIMKAGSLCTPVFALAGAWAQWRLVRGRLGLRGAGSILSLCFAVGLWVCTSLIRAWTFAIRPDMAAIALVMIALWVVVRQPRFCFAYAGVLFYLAWAFKQSVVLALAGVCLHLLFHKRWRDLSALVAIFAVLAAATLLLGTPEFRYSILVAPRVVKEFSVLHALSIGARSAVANGYWMLAPLVLLLAAGARRADDAVHLLVTVFAVALLGGLAGMTKVGGADNYLFEAFVAGSTLLQLAVFAAPGRCVNALLLYAWLLPAIQIALRPAGALPHLCGTVGIATPAEYANAVALRDRLAVMKKPLFTTDMVLSLPWFSNGGRYPALAIDRNYHDATRSICSNGCVEGMLQRGEIPTVLLKSDDTSYLQSLSPKYQKVGEAFYLDRPWSIYTLSPSRQAAIHP
jgi:hypothetical protein